MPQRRKSEPQAPKTEKVMDDEFRKTEKNGLELSVPATRRTVNRPN